jgi:hypothetical protein
VRTTANVGGGMVILKSKNHAKSLTLSLRTCVWDIQNA